MSTQQLKEHLRFEAKMIERYQQRIAQLRGRTANTTGEIARLERQMQAHVDYITARLAPLRAPAFEMMKLRYVHGLRWDIVALRMRYSEQHLFRLHARALQELVAAGELSAQAFLHVSQIVYEH